jgi:hypothetical protein
MLADAVLRYQNHALGAAGVVAELVALAKQLKHEHQRAAELGPREDEVPSTMSYARTTPSSWSGRRAVEEDRPRAGRPGPP